METPNTRLPHPNLRRRKSACFALFSLVCRSLALAQPTPATTANVPTPISAPPQDPPPLTQPASFLAWEADAKNYDAKPGELAAHFSCYVTNVSSEVVVIREVKRSCGCTEAKLPEQPWKLSPGTNGAIVATLDLRGKSGRISKTLTVESSAGSKTIVLNVNIPAAAPTVAASATAPAPTASALALRPQRRLE